MAKVFTITEGLENMGALKTGGQGSVYKGRRIGHITTAVKLLPTPIHNEDPNDKNYIDFQNEVNKLKKVNEVPNPNVVKILNSGITDSGSFPFIEMEFIEGPDLEELLKPPHEPVFTIKEAIKVAEQLSNALAHCHNLDVKHGDIKSNNVKFNKYTGNYVLLDFGLAAMSDEQRRTSLRHAGAIEFMAPEQSEGELLFQSDIYSFGVILFELLAGTVPFPLHDKGESARNLVMVAHLEKPPPDLRDLRRQHLPDAWNAIKKNNEKQIPEWLVSMIYRCLRKKPSERFANGKELNEYIVLNSTLTNNSTASNIEQLNILQEQNQQLFREKELLNQTILRYQQESQAKDAELQSLKFNTYSPQKKGISTGVWIATIITVLVLGGMAYVLANRFNNDTPPEKIIQPEKKRVVIGQYKVSALKAFFHDTTDESTRRTNNFLVTNEMVNALEEKDGFIYTEFTNSRNKTSKGWLRKMDLLTLEEWTKQNTQKPKPLDELYKNELKRAADFVDNNQIEEALSIYRPLIDKEVPEAMYEYGNLALQNENLDIDCETGFTLIEKASEKGYLHAKTTLGYLYLFADNRAVLSIANYDRCEYQKDLQKALTLLKDAALKGDVTAQELLDQYNASTINGN